MTQLTVQDIEVIEERVAELIGFRHWYQVNGYDLKAENQMELQLLLQLVGITESEARYSEVIEDGQRREALR